MFNITSNIKFNITSNYTINNFNPVVTVDCVYGRTVRPISNHKPDCINIHLRYYSTLNYIMMTSAQIVKLSVTYFNNRVSQDSQLESVIIACVSIDQGEE